MTDATLNTFACIGFNGRHLIAGFSQDIQLEDAAYLTPRAMAYGNFSLVGVCLVYVNDPIGTRRTLGFNWPLRAEGQAAHATILEMLRTGRIRTSVGRELDVDEIPAALRDGAASHHGPTRRPRPSLINAAGVVPPLGGCLSSAADPVAYRPCGDVLGSPVDPSNLRFSARRPRARRDGSVRG